MHCSGQACRSLLLRSLTSLCSQSEWLQAAAAYDCTKCVGAAGAGRSGRPPLPASRPRMHPVCPCLADGFGAEGRGSEVPPNATLEIDMALLSWKKVEKVTSECPFCFWVS